MIVYSDQAATAAGGGIGAQVQYAVDRANLAYANSGIATRLRLVHSGPAGYSESGDFSTDLNRLTNVGDGYMNNVDALRNTYAADVVSLFIENAAYCGLGYVYSDASTAFTVVNRGCSRAISAWRTRSATTSARCTTPTSIPTPSLMRTVTATSICPACGVP